MAGRGGQVIRHAPDAQTPPSLAVAGFVGRAICYQCAMPLQNRVDPFGELFATPSRALFLGNRGGRFHADDQKLTRRRWASRQWICCVLDFKNRQRNVWGRYYTELFFLDEVTALAAGHRPCFECRRKDAEAFAEAWRQAFKLLAPAPVRTRWIVVLHAERLDGRAKRLHRRNIDSLPDGTICRAGGGSLGVARQLGAALDAQGLLHKQAHGCAAL